MSHRRVALLLVLITGGLPAMASAAPALPCVDAKETLCGDGGRATAARLLRPAGVAVDRRRGFLVADTGNHAVRRVAPDGRITTIAGLGTPGDDGDGGPAVSATLNAPSDISSASDGTILIADAGNHRVRRVSSNGKIATIAGAGDLEPSTAAQRARDVLLSDPQGVAALADTGLNVVLRVFTDGRLRVVAGTGVAGSLVADIADGGGADGTVRRIGASSIATVAGTPNGSACTGAGGSPSGALWPIFYITAPRSARVRRGINVSFLTTRAATVTTAVLKGRRLVRSVRRRAQPGSNTVSLKSVTAAGQYTLRISAAGQVGTVRVSRSFKAGLKVTK